MAAREKPWKEQAPARRRGRLRGYVSVSARGGAWIRRSACQKSGMVEGRGQSLERGQLDVGLDCWLSFITDQYGRGEACVPGAEDVGLGRVANECRLAGVYP